MTIPRRTPSLGQPPRLAEPTRRREPQLPTHLVPVPARGPDLSAQASSRSTRSS